MTAYYTASRWLLLFFTYSFLGWVWETGYKSVKERRFINRGFLYGPMIPIYGFGAIIILGLTLPVQSSIPLIYIFGAIGASALELFVGFLMETIFHMRWWDYSGKPLNLNGYICLPVSIAWGFFSLLLVKVLHPPIERLVLSVPETAVEIISPIILAAFLYDTIKSAIAALNTRKLVDRIKESSEKFEALRERLSEFSEESVESLKETAKRFETALGESYIERVNTYKAKRREAIELLGEKAQSAIASMENRAAREGDAERASLDKKKRELAEKAEKLRETLTALRKTHDKDYLIAASILRRNPTATYRGGREITEKLRELMGEKK